MPLEVVASGLAPQDGSPRKSHFRHVEEEDWIVVMSDDVDSEVGRVNRSAQVHRVLAVAELVETMAVVAEAMVVADIGILGDTGLKEAQKTRPYSTAREAPWKTHWVRLGRQSSISAFQR